MPSRGLGPSAGRAGGLTSAGAGLVTLAVELAPTAVAGVCGELIPGGSVDGLVGAAAAAGVVLCAAWAGLALLLAGVAALPTALGPAAAGFARALAPTVLHRALCLTVGAGVALAAAPAGAAAATSAPRPSPPGVTRLDRPGVVLPYDRPAAPLAVATRPRPTSGGASTVVVQPGDSLWRIAATALGGCPTDARIAAAWPRWWAANRAVVGADPDLVRPGERLVPPAPTPTEDAR